MRSYFCLYPHCIIRKNNNTVIVYNTENHCYVISKEEPVVNAFEETANYIEYTSNVQSYDFFSQCVECGIGYFIESSHLPFVITPIIRFVTSIEKEKQALGYLSFPHSSQMLKEVTILTTNTIDKGYAQSVYDIIEYPQYSIIVTNVCDLIEKIKGLCSLRTIIISGDLDYISVEKVLKQVNNPSISLVIKTYADFYYDDRVNNIIENYSNIRFVFLFDKSLDITILNAIKCNKYYNKQVFLNFLIEDVSTLDFILANTTIDFIITPIFNNITDNEELKEELYISIDDILNRRASMKDILISDHVNSSCFGSVVIKANGDVTCRNQTLGNIASSDLVYLVNKWVSNPVNCNWFSTRKGRSKCSECIYNFLCPPISIYEEMNIINNACGNKINRS